VSKQYIQGDVMLIPHKLSGKVTARKRVTNSAGLIVARGEESGHIHVLNADDIEIVEINARDQFIEILNDTHMRHIREATGEPTRDHADLFLPTGTYEVRMQRQYDNSFAEEKKSVGRRASYRADYE